MWTVTVFRAADGCFLILAEGSGGAGERLDIAQFTYPFSGHVGCFQFGVVMNKAA